MNKTSFGLASGTLRTMNALGIFSYDADLIVSFNEGKVNSKRSFLLALDRNSSFGIMDKRISWGKSILILSKNIW
jgi:hypothetical protein